MNQIGPNLAELSMFSHHNPLTPPQPHENIFFKNGLD